MKPPIPFACGAALLALACGPVAAAEFDCMVEARRVVNIGAPLEALISAVHVDRGARVRRGQVLVEFDAGVERATGELARFRSEMTGATDARRARLGYATLKQERRAALVAQNFVSRQDADESEAERRLSEAELREAEDNRKVAALEHKRALEFLRQRRLVSPVDGVVIERLMHPGEVSELGRKPILRIAEVRTLNVEAVLPTEAYRQVQRGDAAIVRPEPSIGGEFKAKVSVVDPVLDAASGTFGVRIELPQGGDLPAGVRCRLDLPGVKLKARPLQPRLNPAAAVTGDIAGSRSKP